MTLNVRRRISDEGTAANSYAVAPPPATDPAKLAAFAGAIEQSVSPSPIASSAKHFEPANQQVIRDAFTMPSEDHALFAEIQKKCLSFGIVTTKSEIVRAGLQLFISLDEKALAKAIKAVPKLRTGRRPNK